jgi:CRP/FNR family transcriptional regulator, cyclic AMP receptor protein
MERIVVTNQQKLNVLKLSSYFEQLEDHILLEICLGMSLCVFEAGEVLFWDDEPCAGLHLIETGSVKLFKVSPQGRELVFRTLDAGITFNEVPVFDGGNNPVSVAALEPSRVWVIEAAIIRSTIQKYPALADSVIKNLSHNLRVLVAKVEELSFYQVTHRLARLIEQLPPELLQGNAPNRLTQDQIAARLGTVREVVGRSLRELERSGAIKVRRGRIQIVNSELLQVWTSIPYN